MSKTFNGPANRMPPPVATQFRKGTSGNPKGRPKGAVSIERLTRKFALETQRVVISGKAERISRLEIAILKLKAVAASGKPAAAILLNRLRTLGGQNPSDTEAPALLVPAPMTADDWIQTAMDDNKKEEPGNAVDIESTEFLKAVRGEPSPLGEALLAFHRKYHP